MTASDSNPAGNWPEQIFEVLKRAEIRQVGYVPDAGHSRLIKLCQADPQMHTVSLTTEEEGIALAAGAWLGGQWAEFNPWQLPMSQATPHSFEMMGGLVYRADTPEEVAETVEAAADIAFNGDSVAAVLLGQRLIGRKQWVKK